MALKIRARLVAVEEVQIFDGLQVLMCYYSTQYRLEDAVAKREKMGCLVRLINRCKILP